MPHNLTVRYYQPHEPGSRFAELPGLGVVPAHLLLVVNVYGPRTATTRLGIVHRTIR